MGRGDGNRTGSIEVFPEYWRDSTIQIPLCPLSCKGLIGVLKSINPR